MYLNRSGSFLSIFFFTAIFSFVGCKDENKNVPLDPHVQDDQGVKK